MSDKPVAGRIITRDDLVLSELKGKHEAIGRYDTIIWRVRTGYIAVLYGSLLLFSGKDNGLERVLASRGTAFGAIATIAVLSVALALIDLGFRLRQLKVVDAYNRLTDVAFAMASGDEVHDDIRVLLHNSGESSVPIDRRKLKHAILLIFSLYLAMPALAIAVYTATGLP
jgi:hypothetical protein